MGLSFDKVFNLLAIMYYLLFLSRKTAFQSALFGL